MYTVQQLKLNEQLSKDLDALPVGHRALFAAATTERLLPNYQAFSLLEGWGNYGILRSSLDFVWSALTAGDIPVSDSSPVKKMRRLCMRQMPDADDFVSLFVPLAQDAVSAVVCALEAADGVDAKQIADYAWTCTRTVENYLTDISNPHLHSGGSTADFRRRYEGDQDAWEAMDRMERAKFCREQRELMRQEMFDWVWGSPMMESEIGVIGDDMNLLRRTPQLDPIVIEGLRELAVNRGIRPIQRHLVALSAHP